MQSNDVAATSLDCGIHVVAAGKRFHHSSVLLDLDLILVCGHANQCRQVGGDKTARPPAAAKKKEAVVL